MPASVLGRTGMGPVAQASGVGRCRDATPVRVRVGRWNQGPAVGGNLGGPADDYAMEA